MWAGLEPVSWLLLGPHQGLHLKGLLQRCWVDMDALVDKPSSKAGTRANVHSRVCRYWVCYQVGGWVCLLTHLWDGSWEATERVPGWTRLALDRGQQGLELSQGWLSIHCKDWGLWVWPQWSDLQGHWSAWLPVGPWANRIAVWLQLWGSRAGLKAT